MLEFGETMYYNVSDLVKFFHSFPHYNIQFNPVDAQFNPDYTPYQESLILIAAIPVLWMLLWIIIYMAYFCYFCVTCRKRQIEKSRKSAQPSRWFSFFFSIFAIVVLTVSIYSNEVIDRSLKAAQSDLNKIQTDTGKIEIQSAVILRSIDTLKDETAVSLNRTFLTNRNLDENERPKLESHVNEMAKALEYSSDIAKLHIQTPFKQLEIENGLSPLLKDYEMYRHIATHALSAFLILTTTLSMCSLGCKKKGFILTCVAMAIFNVMVVWVAAGMYSGMAVATSDLCMDPAAYLIKQHPDMDETSDANDILTYFLKCQPKRNPFHEHVVLIQEHLNTASQKLLDMANLSGRLGRPFAQNLTAAQMEISDLMGKLLQFSSFTECTYSHRSYMSAVNSICSTALIGGTSMIGSYMLAGTFLIILVFLMHTTARFIGNKRAYFEVESQDNDYQSRDQHNRSDNPLYYRFSQISATEDNSGVGVSTAPQPNAPPRSSPPPARRPWNIGR